MPRHTVKINITLLLTKQKMVCLFVCLFHYLFGATCLTASIVSTSTTGRTAPAAGGWPSLPSLRTVVVCPEFCLVMMRERCPFNAKTTRCVRKWKPLHEIRMGYQKSQYFEVTVISANLSIDDDNTDDLPTCTCNTEHYYYLVFFPVSRNVVSFRHSST